MQRHSANHYAIPIGIVDVLEYVCACAMKAVMPAMFSVVSVRVAKRE